MKAVSKQLTGSCDKILMGILVEGFCFLDTVIDVLRLRGLLEVGASFKTDDNFGEFERECQNDSNLHHLWMYLCVYACMNTYMYGSNNIIFQQTTRVS